MSVKRKIENINIGKEFKIGELFNTKHDGQIELLEYLGKSKWKIRFVNTGYECEQYKTNIRSGSPQDRNLNKYGRSKYKIGDIITRKDGCKVEIIDMFRINMKNGIRLKFKIKFLDTGFISECFGDIDGINSIRDRLKPTVHRVGIIGYWENLPFEGKLRDCQEYRLWDGILERCYDRKEGKELSYEEATIDPKWIYFENFYYDIKNVEGYNKWKQYKLEHPNEKNIYELDKDIKGQGSKVYCVENCTFIPKEINAGYTSWASKDVKLNLIHKLKTEYGYELKGLNV